MSTVPHLHEHTKHYVQNKRFTQAILATSCWPDNVNSAMERGIQQHLDIVDCASPHAPGWQLHIHGQPFDIVAICHHALINLRKWAMNSYKLYRGFLNTPSHSSYIIIAMIHDDQLRCNIKLSRHCSLPF